MVRDVFPEATIIRPGDTIGHEDRFLHYYASLRVFPFGMIPLLGGGVKTNKMPVYVSEWGGRDASLAGEAESSEWREVVIGVCEGAALTSAYMVFHAEGLAGIELHYAAKLTI